MRRNIAQSVTPLLQDSAVPKNVPGQGAGPPGNRMRAGGIWRTLTLDLKRQWKFSDPPWRNFLPHASRSQIAK